MNNQINIGTVRAFDHVVPNKEQALKPLEEAAEVFGAWQEWDKYHRMYPVFDYPKAQASKAMKEQILSECADVIQAVCNLASSLGVYDLEPYIQACEQRNRERGRISGDGESRTYSPVEIPKQKTCPRCGSKHVITTKAITIGEGKYSEAETDLCLTCRLNFAGEQ